MLDFGSLAVLFFTLPFYTWAASLLGLGPSRKVQKEVNDMANQYRLITILSTAAGEEGIASLTDTIKAKIESGATIDTFDAIGTRELAYEIDGQKNGYYVQTVFTADSVFPKEIERVLKITDGVIRYLIVRVGE